MEQTHMRTDKETIQRLKELAGGQPYAAWLRKHTENLLEAEPEADTRSVILEAVHDKLYRDLLALSGNEPWEEAFDILRIAFPVGYMLDQGELYPSAKTWRGCRLVLAAYPEKAGLGRELVSALEAYFLQQQRRCDVFFDSRRSKAVSKMKLLLEVSKLVRGKG